VRNYIIYPTPWKPHRRASAQPATELLTHLEGLSPELLAGDTHTGVVETSLMLHLCPEQILTEVLAGSLPPQRCHSPLWPYRKIFLSRRVQALFELLFGASPLSRL